MSTTTQYSPLYPGPNTLPLQELRRTIICQLVHRMRATYLWMPDAQYNRILEARKQQGLWLRHQLLSDMLGNTDDKILNARSIYGFNNYRFESRIPRMLSFGYGIGAGLHALVASNDDQQAPNDRADQIDLAERQTSCARQTQSDRRSSCAQLCAIYNFGISLFDRAGDSFRNDLPLFGSIFNEQVLTKLIDDPVGYEEIARIAENITTAELRILLKVIVGFFKSLHQSVDKQAHPEEYTVLKRLLIDAYRSQLQTLLPPTAIRTQLHNAIERKSTLPFMVMSQLIRLHESLSPETDREFDGIVQALGGLFYRLDDLIDLPIDIDAGDVNSLLPSTKDSLSKSDLAEQLLNGAEIPLAVDDVCQRLSSLFQRLQTSQLQPLNVSPGPRLPNTSPDLSLADTSPGPFPLGASPAPEFSFPDMLLAYARSWIPKKLLTAFHLNQTT